MEDEDFTDRMVELLYGELPESDEAAMRAHLERSEPAREAFDRLRKGQELASMLTLDSPEPGLLDGVLAAARDAAAERAPEVESVPEESHRAAAPREADEDEDSGPWGQFLQWIGGFAARPQFAMAMMLFLMIGIGMWYLPEFRGNDPADSQAIIDPAPGDEVGPSALQPAEPLDLEADPRTGRIRPRAEIEDWSPVRRPPVDVSDEVEPPVNADEVPPAAPEPPAVADLESEESEALRAEAQGESEGGQVITAPIVDERTTNSENLLAPGEGRRPQIARVEGRPAPAPVQAPSSIRPRIDTGPLPESLRPESVRVEEDSGGSASDRFQSGMQHYRTRQFRQAAEDFASVVQRPDTDARRLLPSAMHHQARSEAAINNCGSAVRTYEQLLSRYRAYSGAPEAMVEAAQCYQRLGRLTAARRWLERASASSQPAVAQRAHRELTVLAARERAAERAEPAEAAGTPAEADVAASGQ